MFKILSITTACIAFILFAVLLFIPNLVFIIFEISGNESASFIARRAAMLFLGVGVISWLIRNSEHSELRQSICIGLTVLMFSLSLLGTIEFIRGFAGPGIGLAIVTELILGVSYFKIWMSGKNA